MDFPILLNLKNVLLRMTSDHLPKLLKNVSSAALMQNGIDVYDLGVMPTPVVFHESRNYGSGMMITASHNTIAWNGIKL